NGKVNVRGTIAMAKVAPLDNNGNPMAHGGPDSASADFFLNFADNSSNLDNQNSGFTTFGEIVGNTITTLDAIGNLPTFNVSQTPFTDLPAAGDTSHGIAISNLVTISTARVLPLTYTALSDNSSLVSVSTSGGTLLLTYPGSG